MELEELQEKLDFVLERLIQKLDVPLATAEDAVTRINSKLKLILPAEAVQVARTGKGQEIFAIISRTERLLKALEHIENHVADNPKELSAKTPKVDIFDVFKSDKKSDKKTVENTRREYYNYKIDEHAYTEPKGYQYESESEGSAYKKDIGIDEHQRHGKFTTAGLALGPMSGFKKNVHDKEADPPVTQEETVKPWNSKYPIGLTATIPHLRWYQGETIRFETELWNQSPTKIKKIEVTLVQRTVSYTYDKGSKSEHNAKDKAIFIRELVPVGYPVPGRMKRRAALLFKLPFNLQPSSSNNDGSFEVQYFIYLRAQVPMHTGPTVHFGPIRIALFSV